MTKSTTMPGPRREALRQYALRQRALGHVQVKLWVPKVMVPWLHRMAYDARLLHEAGVNPLSRLPDVLLVEGYGEPPAGPRNRVEAESAAAKRRVGV